MVWRPHTRFGFCGFFVVAGRVTGTHLGFVLGGVRVSSLPLLPPFLGSARVLVLVFLCLVLAGLGLDEAGPCCTGIACFLFFLSPLSARAGSLSPPLPLFFLLSVFSLFLACFSQIVCGMTGVSGLDSGEGA